MSRGKMALAVTILLCVFFNDPATTEIYTLSLHDALPICATCWRRARARCAICADGASPWCSKTRSEERFSRNAETDIVCRLLLEKTHRPPPSRTFPRHNPSTPDGRPASALRLRAACGRLHRVPRAPPPGRVSARQSHAPPGHCPDPALPRREGPDPM